ncbi:MAG: VOC family protein [Chromatiales bacterium]|nr:VOC family protein [Chromatiales bacterium]
MSAPGLGAFSHVTIGVADLDTALGFWQQNFGLEVRVDRQGPDQVLGLLWGIDPLTITRQAIVGTPIGLGRWATAGAMHLVEFRDPLPPVRRGAKAWDLLPKNLDLYTTDLPARYLELEAAGHQFRARWAEMRAGQHLFREVQMPGHDEINVVLIEAIGPGYDTTMSTKGYAGIGPLVTIVPDAKAETSFYREVLGMATTVELQLSGPDIERTAGLPPGAGLGLRVFGDPEDPLGRIEIIEYQRLEGEDLYPRAKPPATGILHMNYRVKSLAPVRTRLRAAQIAVTEHGALSALYGSGPILSCHSPAGFRIEVQGET